MWKYCAITCFLSVFTEQHDFCSNLHKMPSFWIDNPVDVTIENNFQVTIRTGGCSERSPQDEITIIDNESASNEELIQLALCQDFDKNWRGVNYFAVTYSGHRKLQSLLIDLTITEEEEVRKRCLKIKFDDFELKSGSKIIEMKLHGITTMEMEVIGRTGPTNYHQNIKIWDQNPEEAALNGNYRRFLYVDTSTDNGFDIVHIPEMAANNNEPHVYNVLRKKADNTTEPVYSTSSKKLVVCKFAKSETSWYKIEHGPKTYRNEIAATAVVISFLVLITFSGGLWYASIAREKSIGVIYCQCDRHNNLYKNAIEKLLNFFENYCLMKFDNLSLSVDPPISGEEEAQLIRRGSYHLVVFIPLPNVANHDRSYETEVHMLSDRYKKAGEKIELNLPFENHVETGMICSEWPKGSFQSIQLFEEMSKLLRYVHPFYLPAFMEKWVRPKLWGPRLEAIRLGNTFTNDHFREITDPKLFPQMKSPDISPGKIDTSLALNAFI